MRECGKGRKGVPRGTLWKMKEKGRGAAADEVEAALLLDES